MNDVEFVNRFMETLKSKMHDFLGQVLILETQAIFANKQIEALNAEKAALVSDYEELQSRFDTLQANTDEMNDISNDIIEKLKTESAVLFKERAHFENAANQAVEELNRVRAEADKARYAAQEAIQSQLNTANHELDTCKSRERSMAEDYIKLEQKCADLQKQLDEHYTPAKPTPSRSINKK